MGLVQLREEFEQLKVKIESMEIDGADVDQSPDNLQIIIDSSSGGTTTALWAKVTAVTDANNYTVAIYNRSDESTAIESGKQARVFDVVDSLAIGDWFPVQESDISGEDYECITQLGVLG